MDIQKYNHTDVEKRYSELWKQKRLDHYDDLNSVSKPYYNLMMFPYPSAEGLHVGNMYAFTGSDIFGRFKRMQGFNVFEPIGLDGFGIHSENFALKIGRHPMDHAEITQKNFYKQLSSIGAMFDWERTVETYNPNYYKWTQWLFTQMFKHGLAYRKKAEVNWCPSCKTVLADEQVIDGSCERCGSNVEKRLLEQWFFRITAYAEKLAANIPTLDWAEKVKIAQRQWIGKKDGIHITYQLKDSKDTIAVFTTTPVNFGMTFLVLAPEHEMTQKIIDRYIKVEEKYYHQIVEYVQLAKKKTDDERKKEGREKTGVPTGLFVVNPINGKEVPVWIADFALKNVGTGAVQGCPGHDYKDFEFAKKYGLPIVRVVVGEDRDTGPIDTKEQVIPSGAIGTMVNSDFLNGLPFAEAMQKTMDYLVDKGIGQRVSTYHLRDWLISRQRYWGPPIPMVYCKECATKGQSWFTTPEGRMLKTEETTLAQMAGWYPVPEAALPVVLPRIEDYKPGNDGVAPLAKHKEFFETTCPGCGAQAVRETDVSDTFLDSSWYFLRYPSLGSEHSKSQIPNSKSKTPLELGAWDLELPWNQEVTRRWLPVHMYTGGAEHSVLHLLYSRFVTMALKDFGYIDFEEPFAKFYAHGLIIKDGAKMSKSKGNVVNPDEYIGKYGCDALRLYLMFTGPFDQGGDFRDSAMEGMSRWLGRVWRMAIESLNSKNQDPNSKIDTEIQKKVDVAIHKLVKRVGDDLEKRRYNTAIAAMMEFTNSVSEFGTIPVQVLKTFLLVLAPFAPYISEELFQRVLNEKGEHDFRSIHRELWPQYNPNLIIEETVEMVVQINGKLRDRLQVTAEEGREKEKLIASVQKREKIAPLLDGKTLNNVIFVPGKLINFVV